MHAKHAVNIEMNDRSGRVIRCENASAYEVPNAEMIDSPTAGWLGLTQPLLPTSALRKMQCWSATIRMGMGVKPGHDGISSACSTSAAKAVGIILR
jgi:hypothetical protein